MPRRRYRSIPPALSLLACACAPTVHLHEPPALQSQQWSGEEVRGTALVAPIANQLGSPELQALTGRALQNNRDIAIASAQIERSRALLRGARQAYLPEVSVSGETSREHKYDKTSPLDFRSSFAQLDIGVELDLFGRISSRIQSALARSRAAELEADAVRLAVETDVAEAWVQRAALARRIEILDRNISRAEELTRVVRVRYEAGAATRVDLGLQSIQLMDLQSERSRLVEALDQTRTALAVLVGEEAPQFDSVPADLDAFTIPQIAPAAPAVVLSQRPDIRASEALIQAANGDVGLARANFFPQINLSASGLLQDLTGSPLLKSITYTSSIFASIFDRGALRADLRIAEADQLEAAERYRLAVLGALAEVENVRGAIRGSGERAVLLDRIVEEARLTARLANVQYIEGEEDLQVVIDAEQWLGDAEEAQALAIQERIFAQIAMYRALGGVRTDA